MIKGPERVRDRQRDSAISPGKYDRVRNVAR